MQIIPHSDDECIILLPSVSPAQLDYAIDLIDRRDGWQSRELDHLLWARMGLTQRRYESESTQA